MLLILMLMDEVFVDMLAEIYVELVLMLLILILMDEVFVDMLTEI